MIPPPKLLLQPDFIEAAKDLFAMLKASVVWDERMRARKTASFGVAYQYSQITYEEAPMPAPLAAICQRIAATLGFLPNNCLLNFYPDGNASMGFHSDAVDQLVPGTGVAIVSLGSVRDIIYRNKVDKQIEYAYPLGDGSLLYMSDLVQQEWLHAIPKADGAGERISLTFRSMRDGASS